MGLITKEVEINVSCKEVRYYENLGYNIPTKPSSVAYKRISGKDTTYILPAKIMVNVNDLPKHSNVKVDCTCDYCSKTVTISYYKYTTIMQSDIKKIACKECGHIKERESLLYKYGVPSVSCLPEIKEKVKNTNLKKLGVDNPMKSDIVKQKAKQTNMDRYGVEWIPQSEEIKNKIKQTMNDKYGVDYFCQCEIGKEAQRQGFLKKYNVDTVLRLKEFHDKGKQTCIEKYGVDSPMKNEEIRNRALKTRKERYGDNDPRYSSEAKIKRIKTLYKNQSVTTSSQQRYISQLYNMTLNYPIQYWNVDMYDIDEKIYVEYDGSGHDMDVSFGTITKEEFEKRELIRFYHLKKLGNKLVRIKSKKDKLPLDNILLKMLSDAKQYFSDYPNHSWITFDIDEGVVRNAENLNGVLFNYGKLRKISKKDLLIA